MTSPDAAIDAFLAAGPYAVAGASRDRAKYGNMVLRRLLAHGRAAHPINPKFDEIEGVRAYADLASLVEDAGPVHGVSIITPPPVTERVVADALALGIRHLWMQPGAESDAAIAAAHGAGITPIAGGPCILVALGPPAQ